MGNNDNTVYSPEVLAVSAPGEGNALDVMQLDTGAQGAGAGVSQGARLRDHGPQAADHVPPLDGVHPRADRAHGAASPAVVEADEEVRLLEHPRVSLHHRGQQA